MSKDNAYIAKCKCGGLVFAGIVTDASRDDLAKEVAECIKSGFEIGRMPCEEVKSAKWCKNHGKCEVKP